MVVWIELLIVKMIFTSLMKKQKDSYVLSVILD